MIFRSITTQLQMWHCAVPSVFLTLIVVLFYQHQRDSLSERIDLELTARLPAVIPLAQQVCKEADANTSSGHLSTQEKIGPEITPSTAISEALEAGCHMRIFSPDMKLLWKSDDAPDLPVPALQALPKKTDILSYEGYREAVRHSPKTGVVALGCSTEALSEKLARLRAGLITITALLIFGGWTGGYLITRRALRPLETISETARSISSGKRGQRINVEETKNELGTLAAVLNESFERQDTTFDQQVQFLADASHELRTPIAVILAKSQLGQLHTDQQRRTEALATCERAAKHMRDLIESLLDLSRLDSGAFSLKKTRGDFAAITQEAIDLLQPLADEKSVTIRTDLASTSCDFDHQRIRQVAINILSNAIKYNLPDDGWIKVSGMMEGENYQLRIENSGKTISPDELPFLFDRFFRADKSRTRSREGSAGLGLAITKAIVEAHGGDIAAESADEITSVTVRLPLSAEA